MTRRDPHFEALRRAETDVVAALMPAGARVLEIGGGSGFQALLLSERGFRVTSVDLAGRPRPLEQLHEVIEYDGTHLPFADASFDVVFSSSVLEHVRDLPALLRETRRVLAPGGLSLHVVPTPAWRAWTLLAHYAFVLKRLIRPQSQVAGGHVPSASEKARERGWGYVLRRVVMPGPHGESPTALHELADFRVSAWRRRMAEGGLVVSECRPMGLFATGYSILPSLSIAARRRLARVLGSGLVILVATSGGTPNENGAAEAAP